MYNIHILNNNKVDKIFQNKVMLIYLIYKLIMKKTPGARAHRHAPVCHLQNIMMYTRGDEEGESGESTTRRTRNTRATEGRAVKREGRERETTNEREGDE